MISKTNTFIEINGERYDAHNGRPLGANKEPAKSIDGFTRAAGTTQPAPVAHPKPAASAAAAGPAAKRLHTLAGHGKTKHAQPSTTLMRGAVKKPAKHGSSLRIQTRTDILAVQPSVSVAPKLSVSNIDGRRASRAKHVAQSNLVSRFGGKQGYAPASSVSQPPVHVAAAAIPAPTAIARTLRPPTARSMDIFERALKHASSHEQKPVAAKRHTKRASAKVHRASRIASVSGAALAIVVLGGFFALQNVANVTVRMASAKAGFAASLPGYRPSGFSVGKFAYGPGSVTINFHSNSDDRRFALTEKPSSWDSDSLLNEYVATVSHDYRTVQSAGRTVYIYGNNDATWVNHGVWYQVTNNSSLSTTQLASIASSI